MAKNANFRVLIAYEAYEQFAAIIRPQKMLERVGVQLESEFDIAYGLRKSHWPCHPHLWEQSTKPRKIID